MASYYDYFATVATDLVVGSVYTRAGVFFTITSCFNLPDSTLSLFNATITLGTILPNTNYYYGPSGPPGDLPRNMKTGLFTTRAEIITECTDADSGLQLTSVSGIGTMVGGTYYQLYATAPYTAILTPTKTNYSFVPPSFIYVGLTQSVVTGTVGTSLLPAKPITPTPTHLDTGIILGTAQISWVDGGRTDDFDVWFGPSGSMALRSSGQAGLTWSIPAGTLSYGVVYQWRIDANNAYGTTTGDVWSFTSLVFAPPYASGDDPSGDGTPGIGGGEFGGVGGTNFMRTVKRLVAAANNTIFFQDG